MRQRRATGRLGRRTPRGGFPWLTGTEGQWHAGHVASLALRSIPQTRTVTGDLRHSAFGRLTAPGTVRWPTSRSNRPSYNSFTEEIVQAAELDGVPSPLFRPTLISTTKRLLYQSEGKTIYLWNVGGHSILDKVH